MTRHQPLTTNHKELAMNASHLSLRHKTASAINRSLAVAALTAFFAAGYADARPKGSLKDPAK